ncbi:hypothetical protein D030_0950B, partial [Vibrio parahaemolyticus AQ3810]
QWAIFNHKFKLAQYGVTNYSQTLTHVVFVQFVVTATNLNRLNAC